MTTLKNKGGHPFTPRNAEEVRHRIAAETVGKQRPARLRCLYRLLKVFVQEEQQRRDDARTKALTDQNALKTAELELRRAEYQRRYNQSEGGIAVLNQRRENERLAAEGEELRRRIVVLEAGREQ
jgi:hypothetical protein